MCRSQRSGDECDATERCDGTSFDCPADELKPAGSVCRAVSGPCDVEEKCDGRSRRCPDNKYKDAGVVCREASGICDVDDVCSGTSGSCQARFKGSDVMCRAAAGECDEAEFCSGRFGDCPRDRKKDGDTCRESRGDCDLREQCDGRSNDCPADRKHNSRRRCRRARGECDVDEFCDGSRDDCPADEFRPSSYVCEQGKDCLADALCPGDGASCPSRQNLPSGTACKHPNMCFVETTCDGSGRCGGGRSTCQCLKDEDCKSDDICGEPFCDNDGTCKLRAVNRNRVCRESKDACDAEERCDGQRTSCPDDGVRPATHVCREAAGACDVAERCDGVTAACPADTFKGADEVCRAQQGACDVAELCTGTAAACPADAKKPAGEVCDDNDKCTRDDKCTPDSKCEGEFVCECKVREDCFPVAKRKRAALADEPVDGGVEVPMRFEDLCQEYKCVDNQCDISQRKSCSQVGQCAPGEGGCQCGANNKCFGDFKCNRQTGYCEDGNCLPGAPGCPCNDGECFEASKKRAAFLRCIEGMCRIDEGRLPPVAPCTPGEDGCHCRAAADAAGRCDSGKCTRGRCTASCEAGEPGCACVLDSEVKCNEPLNACNKNKCVFFPEDCGNGCTLGDPGCCCLADNTCNQVERKREVYVNVCNSDKVCVIETLPGEPPRPPAPESDSAGGSGSGAVPCSGGRAIGDAWTGTSDANGDEVSCFCTPGGDLCDACYQYADSVLECNRNADRCVFGAVEPHGAGCFDREQNPAAGPPIGALGGACTLNGRACDGGAACDERTSSCVDGVQAPGVGSAALLTTGTTAVVAVAIMHAL